MLAARALGVGSAYFVLPPTHSLTTCRKYSNGFTFCAAHVRVIADTTGIALCLPAKRFMEVVKGRPTLLAKLYELAVEREDETRSVLGVAAEEIGEFIL